MKTHEFDRIEDWLAARRTMGIGSTDAPAILGVSRFKSPFALFHEKRRTLERPLTVMDAELASWGLDLEDIIADRYRIATGRQVELTGEGNYVLQQHDDLEWMVASVDRYALVREAPDPEEDEGDEENGDEAPAERVLAPVGVRVVLELKNAHFMMREHWTDEPPLEYVVQLQHQLAVTGMPWGSIAALVGGTEFRWADIQRNDVFIEQLIAAEREFLERVERNDPPPPDGSAATTRLLKALFPKDDGETIELPPEALDVDAELEAAKLAERDAVARKKAASNQMKALMGAASVGVLRNGTIYTYRQQKRAAHAVPEARFRVLRRRG